MKRKPISTQDTPPTVAAMLKGEFGYVHASAFRLDAHGVAHVYLYAPVYKYRNPTNVWVERSADGDLYADGSEVGALLVPGDPATNVRIGVEHAEPVYDSAFLTEQELEDILV